MGESHSSQLNYENDVWEDLDAGSVLRIFEILGKSAGKFYCYSMNNYLSNDMKSTLYKLNAVFSERSTVSTTAASPHLKFLNSNSIPSLIRANNNDLIIGETFLFLNCDSQPTNFSSSKFIKLPEEKTCEPMVLSKTQCSHEAHCSNCFLSSSGVNLIKVLPRSASGPRVVETTFSSPVDSGREGNGNGNEFDQIPENIKYVIIIAISSCILVVVICCTIFKYSKNSPNLKNSKNLNSEEECLYDNQQASPQTHTHNITQVGGVNSSVHNPSESLINNQTITTPVSSHGSCERESQARMNTAIRHQIVLAAHNNTAQRNNNIKQTVKNHHSSGTSSSISHETGNYNKSSDSGLPNLSKCQEDIEVEKIMTKNREQNRTSRPNQGVGQSLSSGNLKSHQINQINHNSHSTQPRHTTSGIASGAVDARHEFSFTATDVPTDYTRKTQNRQNILLHNTTKNGTNTGKLLHSFDRKKFKNGPVPKLNLEHGDVLMM